MEQEAAFAIAARRWLALDDRVGSELVDGDAVHRYLAMVAASPRGWSASAKCKRPSLVVAMACVSRRDAQHRQFRHVDDRTHVEPICRDRKRVVQGRSVSVRLDLGGRRRNKKKNN